jgi:hypothetical protein
MTGETLNWIGSLTSMIIHKGYKKVILDYLRDLRTWGDGWEKEYNLRAKQTPFGWIGARGDRDVRDLIKDGYLESSKEGKYRIVRYSPPKPLTPEETKAEELAHLQAALM